MPVISIRVSKEEKIFLKKLLNSTEITFLNLCVVIPANSRNVSRLCHLQATNERA